MRRLIAILAAVVSLSLTPGWASAGSKIELTDSEMDGVSAGTAGGFLEVYLLSNPVVRSILLNSNGSNFQVKVNGLVAPVINTPPPAGVATLPIQLLTQSKTLGSQNGLGLGLIQKTTTTVVQGTVCCNPPSFYKPPFR